MKLEDHKKQIDDFFNSHTPEQLKEKLEKYNYLSKPKKAFYLYDVMCSNLALLWWGWCTVWGVVGIIFGFIKLWNYYT